MTLWQGRFGAEGPAEELLAFTVSLSYDRRLAADDLTGSMAHVRGLARAGLVSEDDATILLAALDRVAEEFDDGGFVFKAGDEDVHTAVERRVTEIAGAVGRPSPHRAQSQRSDRDRPAPVRQTGAGRHRPPGRRPSSRSCSTGPRRPATPTCPVTPISSGPSRCCWPTICSPTVGPSARDVDRLMDTRRRLDVSPLGAGALAGSSLPLDPDGVADDLGLCRPLRQLPRRRLRSRLRRRSPLRPGPPRRAPVPARRGDRALVDRGVRLSAPERRLRHRQLDAAAEEESRHRRVGARARRAG